MNVGVIGVGAVGSSLLRQLARAASTLETLAGEPVVVLRAAVRDRRKPRDCPDPVLGYTEDPGQLVEDARLDVLVEVVGGEHWLPAIEAFLRSGRPVVTANKALLARHGPRLFQLARDCRVPLRFEAAVGGAVPVIRTLLEARRGERFHYVGGVLNGTANFLLDRLSAGVSFGAALEEAQSRGLAETDPSDDVEGLDAARKLSVLVQLAFGAVVLPEAWPRAGIAGLEAEIVRAVGPGLSVKLVAEAWRTDHGITGYVGPAAVPATHLLGLAHGPENAILLDGEPGGPTGLLGLGAGGEATASQVIGDLMAVARTREAARLSVPDPGEPVDLVPARIVAAWPGQDRKTLRELKTRLPPEIRMSPETGRVGPADAALILALPEKALPPPIIVHPAASDLRAPPPPV